MSRCLSAQGCPQVHRRDLSNNPTACGPCGQPSHLTTNTVASLMPARLAKLHGNLCARTPNRHPTHLLRCRANAPGPTPNARWASRPSDYRDSNPIERLNSTNCIRNAPGWSRELPAFLAEHFGYNPFHYEILDLASAESFCSVLEMTTAVRGSCFQKRTCAF